MDFKLKENADVSLHDCRTNKILYNEHSISFFIPDGFYLIHDEKEKDSFATENYNAEVSCRFNDGCHDRFCVIVYRKNIFGQTVREDWTDKFISAINDGKVQFEFVYTYRSYHKILFQGYLWKIKKPWLRECEIEIFTDEITYSWNEREIEPIVIKEK